MKIIMIVPSLHNGGAERVVSTFANQLAKLGVEVHLVVHEDKIEYDISSKVHLDKLIFNYNLTGWSRALSLLGRIFKLRKKISKISPDLIICFLTGCSMQVLASQLFSKNKVLVCEHNNYFALKSPLKRLLRNILYLRAENISVLTKGDVGNYPILLRRKMYVQENPLPWKVIEDFEPRTWSGKLLAVGRLEYQKNHEELIDIIWLCRNHGLNIQLSVVGEGSLLSKLKSKVEELSLSKQIKFLGRRTDMHELYKSHDILVMTSHYEGLPMVISEAFSHALPVISYECPTGPSEMISNGKNGFLIDMYSKESFVDSLISIDSNAELYTKMQFSALKSAARWDTVTLCKLFYSKLDAMINGEK